MQYTEESEDALVLFTGVFVGRTVGDIARFDAYDRATESFGETRFDVRNTAPFSDAVRLTRDGEPVTAGRGRDLKRAEPGTYVLTAIRDEETRTTVVPVGEDSVPTTLAVSDVWWDCPARSVVFRLEAGRVNLVALRPMSNDPHSRAKR